MLCYIECDKTPNKQNLKKLCHWVSNATKSTFEIHAQSILVKIKTHHKPTKLKCQHTKQPHYKLDGTILPVTNFIKKIVKIFIQS